MATIEPHKHLSKGVYGCHYQQMFDWFTIQILREMRRSPRTAGHFR